MRLSEGHLRRLIREELSRRLLVERELKWSQDAFNKIEDFVFNKRGSSGIGRDLYIPPEEIYYFDSRQIRNGAIAFEYLHNKEYSERLFKNSSTFWDSKIKEFKPEWAKSQLRPIKFSIALVKLNGKSASFGIREGKFYICIDPDIAMGPEHFLGLSIKHELQHFTQKVNQAALEYGQQLDKSGGDCSKIVKLDLKEVIGKSNFGSPVQKTQLKQSFPVNYNELSDEEREKIAKTYLADDNEYEPWTSALASELTDWAIAKRGIPAFVRDFTFSLLKEKIDTNGLPGSMTLIKSIAKKLAIPANELITKAREAPGINNIAVSLISMILKNKDLADDFHNFSEERFLLMIDAMKEYRLQEFTGDMIVKLKDSLDNLAKKWSENLFQIPIEAETPAATTWGANTPLQSDDVKASPWE